MVQDGKPDVLLLGATPNGRDLAGRLAVRLRTGLTADCTGLSVDPERRLLRGDVVGFGGGIVATILCWSTVRRWRPCGRGSSDSRSRISTGRGDVRSFPVVPEPEDARVRVLERSVSDSVDLTRAGAIVAVGPRRARRHGRSERLAQVVARGDRRYTRGRRPGWIGRERQIGQTGVVTAPRIVVCCGISDAIHFTVGVDKAECVVAINTDPDAPIFEHADYCIVDDMFAVLRILSRSWQRQEPLRGNAMSELHTIVCMKVVPMPEEVRGQPETMPSIAPMPVRSSTHPT